jgi:hypothetical protein
MLRARFALCAVTLFAASASARPHNKTPPPAKPQAAPAAPSGTITPDDPSAADPPGVAHAEGDYGGVVPGQPQRNDNKGKIKRSAAKGTLTWIGFEAKNGGAEVFFQSVAPFELEQHVEGGQLVVVLGGLNRLGQNTWRPVDTRFFDNPLAKIAAARVGAARATKDKAAHAAGIEIRIAFKNAKDAHEATVKSATEADGMFYAYLSFGEGADQAAPTVQDPER